mmetsp:Transcript_4183/g.9068  ORF Transcript_4183/g.9068 Transcript_4183/m.9068 type:complete len:206 (+) Transcript_4183:600-1217(+)
MMVLSMRAAAWPTTCTARPWGQTTLHESTTAAPPLTRTHEAPELSCRSSRLDKQTSAASHVTVVCPAGGPTTTHGSLLLPLRPWSVTPGLFTTTPPACVPGASTTQSLAAALETTSASWGVSGAGRAMWALTERSRHDSRNRLRQRRTRWNSRSQLLASSSVVVVTWYSWPCRLCRTIEFGDGGGPGRPDFLSTVCTSCRSMGGT